MDSKFRILRLTLFIGPTSAPYNQFSLPILSRETQQITICTFFEPDITPPEGITLYKGDGTIWGFIRLLYSVLNTQTFDIVHVHYCHIGIMLVALNLFLGRPLQRALCTVHNSYPNYKLRNKLLFLPVFAAFPRVVTCSYSSYRSFPKLYKMLAGSRLRVIPNGMDINRVDNVIGTEKLTRESSIYKLVIVNRLVLKKNNLLALRVFCESFNQNNNLRLMVIGEGPLKEELKKEASIMGIDEYVQFTGLIPREEVYKQLADADLFLSTSKGEGLPISVLEAMACHCPVLLSDIPPHREIAEGVGFIPLVRPDDKARFVKEIKRFCNISPSERQNIGQKCRELVEERFKLAMMLEKYHSVYRELCGNKKH